MSGPGRYVMQTRSRGLKVEATITSIFPVTLSRVSWERSS